MAINPLVPDIGEEEEQGVPPQQPWGFASPSDMMDVDEQGYQFDPAGYFGAMGEAINNDIIQPMSQFFSPPEEAEMQVAQLAQQRESTLRDYHEDIQRRDPESDKLIKAVDSGYADKKLITPIEQIRQAVQLNDEEALDKAYLNLQKLLSKNTMSFAQKFADNYLGTGIQAQHAAVAAKMAADIIAHEMNRPKVESALRLGLITPDELNEGQTSPQFSHLIPQEPFAMDEEGMPVSSVQEKGIPAQPGQQPSGMTLTPGARLDDLQAEVVGSRQKGIQARMGIAQRYGAGQQPRAKSPSDIALMGVESEREAYRQANGLAPGSPLPPDVDKEIIYKWSGLEHKSYLDESKKGGIEARADRDKAQKKKIEAETDIVDDRGSKYRAEASRANAQAAYYNRLPSLQKELAQMKSAEHPQHEVFQAIGRVRDAISKGEQPNTVDSALFKSFLMKGGAEYRADVLGRLYDAYTGEHVDESVKGEQSSIREQLMKFIGNLFEMVKGGTTDEVKQPVKPTPATEKPKEQPAKAATPKVEAPPAQEEDLPTPKTPEEARKLKPGTRYRMPNGNIRTR